MHESRVQESRVQESRVQGSRVQESRRNALTRARPAQRSRYARE